MKVLEVRQCEKTQMHKITNHRFQKKSKVKKNVKKVKKNKKKKKKK